MESVGISFFNIDLVLAGDSEAGVKHLTPVKLITPMALISIATELGQDHFGDIWN
jgi:hypothetical protein